MTLESANEEKARAKANGYRGCGPHCWHRNEEKEPYKEDRHFHGCDEKQKPRWSGTRCDCGADGFCL